MDMSNKVDHFEYEAYIRYIIKNSRWSNKEDNLEFPLSHKFHVIIVKL